MPNPEDKDQNNNQDKPNDKLDIEQEKPSNKTIKIPSFSGKEYDLSKEQLVEVARYGLTTLEKETTEPEEKEEEKEEKEEDKLDENDYIGQLKLLNKRIEELQKDREKDKEERKKEKQADKEMRDQQALLNALDTESEKYEELRKDKDLKALIHKAVYAEIIGGNKNSVADIYKQETDKLFKYLPKKEDNPKYADTKIAAMLQQITRGGSGIPNIDAEKKFTPEDVKSGKSKEALIAFLESQ